MKLFALFITFCQLCLASDTLTFFIAADPHVGREQWDSNEAEVRAAIHDMNNLPGKKYPNGEIVKEPEGLLIAGDLTGDSVPSWNGYWFQNWRDGFEQLFPVDGKKGICRFPSYEGYGNHDFENDTTRILTGIYIRNLCRTTPVNISQNGLHYSWDWKGIHFVNLNLYPGNSSFAENSLEFLKHDLVVNLSESNQPIILYYHYPPSYTDLWPIEEQISAYQVMKGYNIIAIFVGHSHRLKHIQWNNLDVFYIPTLSFLQKYFVVRIKDNTLFINLRKNGDWHPGIWTKTFMRKKNELHIKY